MGSQSDVTVEGLLWDSWGRCPRPEQDSLVNLMEDFGWLGTVSKVTWQGTKVPHKAWVEGRPVAGGQHEAAALQVWWRAGLWGLGSGPPGGRETNFEVPQQSRRARSTGTQGTFQIQPVTSRLVSSMLLSHQAPPLHPGLSDNTK